MVCHGLSWFVMVCHGLSWFVMVCHGLSWFVMVCHGLSWFVMVCHGLSWFVMVCHGFSDIEGVKNIIFVCSSPGLHRLNYFNIDYFDVFILHCSLLCLTMTCFPNCVALAQ